MPETTVKSKPHKSKRINQKGDKPLDSLKIVTLAMKREHYRQDSLIKILHKAQETIGYLEPEVLDHVARGLKLPLSRVYGVATFYNFFSLKPQGKHTCVVCVGTACDVKGSSALLDVIEKEANLRPGETTADGQISLMTARCIGSCGLAPVAVYDGKINGKETPESSIEHLKSWLNSD